MGVRLVVLVCVMMGAPTNSRVTVCVSNSDTVDVTVTVFGVVSVCVLICVLVCVLICDLVCVLICDLVCVLICVLVCVLICVIVIPCGVNRDGRTHELASDCGHNVLGTVCAIVSVCVNAD